MISFIIVDLPTHEVDQVDLRSCYVSPKNVSESYSQKPFPTLDMKRLYPITFQKNNPTFIYGEINEICADYEFMFRINA